MAYATSSELSENILELASSKIDELTFNRIIAIGFNNLTSFQQTKVKNATLAQAEFYDNYGTDVASISSFSILDTSISFGAGNSPGVSPMAISELKQTGLMRRVV